MAWVGEIKSIIGFTPKEWDKYAIHVIEPLLRFIPDDDEIVQLSQWKTGDRTTLHVLFSSGIDAHVATFGDSNFPISFKIIGTKGCINLQFTDAFQCLKMHCNIRYMR